MLTKLYIQNIALIQKAQITLEPGLNVFTGETGAGKTILISAIDAVLGERVSREIIRKGEEKAVVSALFENISISAGECLTQLGYQEDDGGVLITREISAGGKSGSKINGMPATASILKQLAPLLIQIHGQRDTHQLLSNEHQMEMIDNFAVHSDLMREYRAAYDRWRAFEREKSEIQIDENQKAQRLDMLSYQLAEIEAAALESPDEEDELIARKKLISAGGKVLDALSTAYGTLSGEGESQGITSLFDTFSGGVERAAEYIPALEQMSSRLDEIGYELNEYASELRGQLESLEFDPGELYQVENRLGQIHGLKRKYGSDIAAILEYEQAARLEAENLELSEQRLALLNEQLADAMEKAREMAEKLTRSRSRAVAAFMKLVEAELAFLDMPSVKLSVRRTEKPLASDGWDDIAFYLATNIGEEPGALSKIASGGELSRLMLAMKNVLANRDGVGTLIFDEVDTGVSGRAAQKIGQKLSEVSRGRQVIAVTHLAGVAAFADRHMFIHKEIEDGRTFTRITQLSPEGRESEVARITSGDNLTSTALENARELIAHAAKLKNQPNPTKTPKGAKR